MPTIGVADILISPVFKDLQKNIGRELDGAAESVGKSSGSKMGDALGGALKAGAVAIAGGALAGIGVALTKGFVRLHAIENDKAKLSGLGHTAETVQGIMDNAMAAVKGTAFGLDEAASVAAGAVAAGVKPGVELERTLRLTGDAATIAGVGMGEMGAIFNKVASSNKIQGDVIAQLNDAGIPIVQLMAKELGKTAEETVNLASEGKINFETFQKAMENGLGGAALKSGDTLQGAFKNTMAAVGRIGANLLSGVYPKIREFFSGAIEWLKPLEEGAKVAGAAIGDFLNKALTGAQGLYDLLVKGDFSGKLTAAFGWEEDSPIVDFLLRVHDGAKGIYDLLVKGDYTGMLQRAFGWEEDSKAVDFLLGVRDAIIGIASGITMDAATREQFSGQLEGWVKAGADIREAFEKSISVLGDVIKKIWEFREPIGIIVGLIVLSLIPHWAALGVEALKSAAQQKIAWGITKSEAIGAAFAHSWAVVTMIGGWVLMGAQALIQGARIAAGWLLAMGPVGWIIGIVALLVGAFIAAYNNIGWFKDGVDAAMRWVGDAVGTAFHWIQDVIGGVVDWFTGTVGPAWDAAIQAIGGFFMSLWTDWIKPAFDFISGAPQAVIDAIGGAFTWLYETIIKPVFDGIAAAVKWVGDVFTAFYEATLKPIFDSAAVIIGGFALFFNGIGQLIVSVITYIVLPLFRMFWDQVVATFNGIMTAIGDWWNGVVGIFNDVVSFIRDVFSAVFTWLYESVIKPTFDGISAAVTWLFEGVIRPVFDGIGTAVRWVWDNVLKPTFDSWVWFFTSVIPDAVNWLYNNAIQPVFRAIGDAANWVWTNVLKPVFDTLVNFFTVVIPNAANWLYVNGIKPAFNGVGDAIKWVWENVIKPVFDTLSNFIQKTIPDAFNAGVDFIKTAWDRIQDIAKAPVRFVIDTVINDGLIGAFNNIANVLPGIDKLPRVALPAGFADGGYTGDGGKYQPAGIVHAGEFVFTKEQTKRAGVANLYALAGALAGYANGGLVNPLRNAIISQPFSGSHNGIDFAAPTGTPIGAAGPGRVSSAGWSSYGGGNEIHIDHPNGLQTWYAHLSSFAVKLGDMVRAGQLIGQVGSTGNSTGPHLHYMVLNGGWPSYVNPAPYLDGGGEAGTGGWNPIAGIIDGLVGQFKNAFPAAGMIADLAIGVGKKLLTNVSDFIMGNGGKDKGIGSTGLPYLHDQGGVLNPGLSSIMNATRKPEAILNAQQWADIHRLAMGNTQRAAGVNIGTVHVRDENEMVRLLRTSEQDAQAVYAF